MSSKINDPLSSNPFAALAELREQLPPGDVQPPAAPPSAPPEQKQKPPAKAVVRYERKGRGGKEATVVEQLGLSPEEAQAWSRALKRTLGCGGKVEGDRLVFAGDQRGRVEALLRERGVKRVISGS